MFRSYTKNNRALEGSKQARKQRRKQGRKENKPCALLLSLHHSTTVHWTPFGLASWLVVWNVGTLALEVQLPLGFSEEILRPMQGRAGRAGWRRPADGTEDRHGCLRPGKCNYAHHFLARRRLRPTRSPSQDRNPTRTTSCS